MEFQTPEQASAEEPSGSLRAKLANAMVSLTKDLYGRGPTAAKAWILDDYVFVAMEGGLTRSEETLLASGRGDLVRTYRTEFQDSIRDQAMGVIEEILGRPVATYHSQIVFDPVRTFEIFVLRPEG